jgi:hypothetical protein
MDPVTKNPSPKCLFPLVAIVLLVLSGCGRKMARLHELEANSAGAIERCLSRYEATHPGLNITNLPQVLNGAMVLNQWHSSHPAYFEMEFRKLGKYAGFTNSFYEKYIRVPPGVTNQAFPKDPIFMNAYPFPDFDGRYGRYVIWREHPQTFRATWARESQVQEAFQRAGVPIPKPSPMPKPPYPGPRPQQDYPLKTRTMIFFKELCRDNGLNPQFWFPVMLVCVGGPLIIGITLFLWFWRSRHRRLEAERP